MSLFLIELAATKSTEMEIHLKSWREMSGEYESGPCPSPLHKDSSYTDLFDIVPREKLLDIELLPTCLCTMRNTTISNPPSSSPGGQHGTGIRIAFYVVDLK
jgi:hypothetical protein